METSNDMSGIQPLETLDRESQKIVIFDDFVTEKNQTPIVEYFTGGRYRDCSSIYLSQSYFNTPKPIRLNCTHFCIGEFPTKHERNSICNELGVTREQYENATCKLFSFLYVDKPKKTVTVISMGLFNDEIHTIAGEGERGPPGIWFTLTSNGDFDIKRKRLTDVGSPTKACDSTTKEYVDLNDTYRSVHAKKEFLLTSGNFNTSNSMSVFVLGKYTDFSRTYHNAPSHIICSLSQSPAVITINLGKLQHGVYGCALKQ